MPLGKKPNLPLRRYPRPLPIRRSLPPVVVETKQEAPKAKAKAKKKASSKGPIVATQQPAPQPPAEPTGPGNANASDKTAYGPVKDYSAKNTATGIKTDTPLKEIPQSISVVGAEQIRDQGAHTLQETLRYLPGVIADGYGFDGRTDSSFIRGTEAAEYLDGLKRTFNYYIYNYRIDPYFMERIEVLRGPASVLYGQAPVGGILNAVSKRPQSEQGGEITVEYGTFDFKQVKFDMTGPVTSDGKWSYRLTGAARDAETQVDYVDDDRLRAAAGHHLPARRRTPASRCSATSRRTVRDRRRSFSRTSAPSSPTSTANYISQDRFGGEPSDHYDTDAASGTLLVEHKFNSVFKLQHSMRYSDIHNDYHSSYPGFFAGDYYGTPPVPNYDDPQQTTMQRIKSISIADTQIFNTDTNLEAKFSTGILTHKVLGGLDYANFRAQFVLWRRAQHDAVQRLQSRLRAARESDRIRLRFRGAATGRRRRRVSKRGSGGQRRPAFTFRTRCASATGSPLSAPARTGWKTAPREAQRRRTMR